MAAAGTDAVQAFGEAAFFFESLGPRGELAIKEVAGKVDEQ